MKINLTDKAVSSNVEITPEGYLICDIDFARIGIQSYLNKELVSENGLLFPEKSATAIINVLRPENEVFDTASLNSFSLIPLTNGHPKGTTLLDAKTAKFYSVGTTGENVQRNGDFARLKIKVTDLDVVQSMKVNKQFSAGYTSIIEPYTAIIDGIQIHAKTTKIRGNHLAVNINNARCGNGCSIKDSKYMKTKEEILANIKIELSDDIKVALSDALSEVETDSTELVAKITDAEAQIVTLTQQLIDSKAETLTVKADWDSCKSAKEVEIQSVQAKLDDVTAKLTDSESKVCELASVRAQLIVDCKTLLPDVDTNLSNLEMKRAVVSAKCHDLKDTASLKPEAYIDGRFEALKVTPTLDALDLSNAGKRKEKTAEIIDSQIARAKANGLTI